MGSVGGARDDLSRLLRSLIRLLREGREDELTAMYLTTAVMMMLCDPAAMAKPRDGVGREIHRGICVAHV